MKSIASSFTCVKRTPPPSNDIVWARRLVADPSRYGATERERLIVADLLSQVAR